MKPKYFLIICQEIFLKMIQLTPLDKTVAGQELIQMGRIEGEIVGKIHLAQRLMKRKITPERKLLEQNPKELRAILKKLETELKAW